MFCTSPYYVMYSRSKDVFSTKRHCKVMIENRANEEKKTNFIFRLFFLLLLLSRLNSRKVANET